MKVEKNLDLSKFTHEAAFSGRHCVFPGVKGRVSRADSGFQKDTVLKNVSEVR